MNFYLCTKDEISTRQEYRPLASMIAGLHPEGAADRFRRSRAGS